MVSGSGGINTGGVSGEPGGGPSNSGGIPAAGGGTDTGGTGVGGMSVSDRTGGVGTGGVSSGGSIGTGGTGTGGEASGGRAGTGGAGTGGAGTGGSCQSPQVMCGTACTSTQNDGANCGRCGVACTVKQVCVNGACQCAAPTQSCSGSCIDTSTDPGNCGACGHDCRFGTCTASKCDPVLLQTATNTVNLASDGASVYALDYDGGIIYGCALAQCGRGGTMSPLRDGLTKPVYVLSVPSVGSVFISQFAAGSVLSISGTGTLKSTITIPSASITIGLATDGANLYIGAAGQGIQKTPLAGNTPTAIFADTTREVLYDAQTNSLFAVQTDRVLKCPLSGTTCTTFFPATTQQMNAVAVAGGRLFVTLLDTVTPLSTKTGLFSCSTAGSTCTPTALLSGPAAEDPFWMTADATYVYLRMRDGIYRCAVGGCAGAASFVTASPVLISQIADDATAIYWSGYSTGAGRGVYRFAKQP